MFKKTIIFSLLVASVSIYNTSLCSYMPELKNKIESKERTSKNNKITNISKTKLLIKSLGNKLILNINKKIDAFFEKEAENYAHNFIQYDYCHDNLDSPYNEESKGIKAIKEELINNKKLTPEYKTLKFLLHKINFLLKHIKDKAINYYSNNILKSNIVIYEIKKLQDLAAQIYELINMIKNLENASPELKYTLIKIANELSIKNPEKIQLKILPSSGNEIEAFTTITEDIFITKNFDNLNNTSNQLPFILGHELTHLKYKHALIGTLIIITLTPVLGYAFSHKTFKCKDLEINILIEFIFTLLSALTPMAIKYFFMKYCEIEADLGAASLGAYAVSGGIELFKSFINSGKDKNRNPLDVHASCQDRVNYLTEYAIKKYK